MKKLKLLSTILLIAILSSVFIMPTMAVTAPELGANAIILVDLGTGNALYAKNEDEQLAPASLTKIMTVMLAVEAIENGTVSQYDSVTATGNMTFDLIADGSTAGIVVGETMNLEDLLYCAMVKSANEACNIIAEYIGGTISEFVAMMNAKATELGCQGTNFVNTHGIPDSNHYTTASDMAIITQAAMSSPIFAAICNTAEITIAATNESEARHLVNTNGLIADNAEPYTGYYYEYASGVKTGHTEAAGYCLVSTAQKNGVSLLCVVMGGKATSTSDGMSYGSFTDTVAMYEWAFENYSYRDIIKITDLITDVPVVMGSDADFVSLHPLNSVRALLPNDDDLQRFEHKIVIYSEQLGEDLVAPVEAGTVLGEVSIVKDGVVYGSSPLVASSAVGLSYRQFMSERISETLKKPVVVLLLIIVLLIVAVYIFLILRYNKSKRDYHKQKGMAPAQPVKRKAKPPVPVKQAAPAKPPERAPVKTPAKAPAKAPAPPPIKAPARKPAAAAPLRSAPTASKGTREGYFAGPAGSDSPALAAERKAREKDEQAERDYFEEFFGKKD